MPSKHDFHGNDEGFQVGMFYVQHCPGCSGSVSSFVLSSNLGAGAVVILILWVRRLKQEEVKWFAQSTQVV